MQNFLRRGFRLCGKLGMDPGLRRDDGTNAIGAVSSGAGAQLVEADRGVRLQARSSLARQLQCPCCWKNALKLS